VRQPVVKVERLVVRREEIEGVSLDVRVPALYSGYLMRRLVNAIVCRNAPFGDPILYERGACPWGPVAPRTRGRTKLLA